MGRKRANGEGSIFQITSGPSKGRWCGVLDVGREGGKRKRRYFYGDTQGQVVGKMADAKKKRSKGLRLPSDRLTIGGYLAQWIEGKRGHLKPRTFRSYSDNVRLHITPALGHFALSALVRSDVQAFADQKAKEPGLSPRTAQYLCAILRSALNDALADRLVEYNPAGRISMAVPKGKKHPLTREEALAVLAKVKDHRWAALYILALSCGMREGEVLGLHWRSVDLTKRTVSVVEQLQRYDKAFHLDSLKTAGSARTLPLGTLALDALRLHRAKQRELRMFAGKKWEAGNDADAWPCFTTRRGRFIHQRTVLEQWYRLLAAAKLPRRRFHDIRHSAASLALFQKASMKEVQEMLGHSSIRITADTYASVYDEAKRETADRIDALLTGDEKRGK